MSLALKQIWLARKAKLASLSVAALIVALVGSTVPASPAMAVDGSVLVNCTTSGTFRVTTSGSNVTVDQGSTCSGEAQIPAEVTSIGAFAFANVIALTSVTFSGTNLRSIGDYAFTNTRLTAVVIPAGVTSIGQIAFQNSSTLASVTFASGSQLATLGATAFAGLAQLTSVTLPATLITIGTDCFKNDTRLASLTFASGSQLTSIADGSFSGTALTAVTIPSQVQTFTFAAFPANVTYTIASDNPNFMINGGVLFNRDMTSIKGYPSSLTATSYTIPSTVTSIGANAFQNAQFTSVSIPSSVTSFGTYAFSSSRLTSITIPASVASIGNYAFSAVPNLASVTFAPSSALTFLNNGVFQNNSNLVSLNFGSGSHLVTIDSQAVRSSGLVSVTIPASVENINPWAFYGSNRLTSVNFEANSRLRYIGTPAFEGTPIITGAGTVTLPAPPIRTGYNFVGWSATSAGTAVTNGATLVTSNGNLYSLWQLKRVPVSFDSKSGSSVDSTEFIYGGAISAPTAPTRVSYTFSGWSLTDGGSAVTFPYTSSSDTAVVFYARWSEIVASIAVGNTPNSQVATIPSGGTAAAIPATADLPQVKLSFAAASSSSTAVVVPIANPAAPAATPFIETSATKIVDVEMTGVTGPVTICLDGAETDHIFHFTGGAWVELPQRTYVNGQVCGVTESFSPFTASQPKPVVVNTTYTGPRITGRSQKLVTTQGAEFTITGERLSQVSSVSLDGKALVIASKSDSNIVLKVPAHAPGLVDLVFKSDSASLTFSNAFEFKEPAQAKPPVSVIKSTVSVGATAKSLNAKQRALIGKFVGSAKSGALLTCSATMVSKSDVQAAKALAVVACASAKQLNPGLLTKVSAPSIVTKGDRKVLLSLTN